MRPYLAHVVHAVVDVDGAVLSLESWGAVAGVVGEVVPADPAVLAWLELWGGAEVDLVLAEVAGVSAVARAHVAADPVDAGGVVLAPVPHAVIHIFLTPVTRDTSVLIPAQYILLPCDSSPSFRTFLCA